MPGRKHPFFQGPFIKNDGKLTKPLAISLSYFFLPSFRSINHQNLLYREYLYIPSSWKPVFLKKEFLIFHLIKLDMFNVGRCPINIVDWKWHTIIWKMILHCFFLRGNIIMRQEICKSAMAHPSLPPPETAVSTMIYLFHGRHWILMLMHNSMLSA